MVSPNTFANPPSNKSNVFERDWSKFDQENFILDYFDIDWSNLLNLNEKNVDLTTNNFLNAMNSLLNKYATSKKFSKYKLKFKTKPWITFGIQKSISIKNKLLKKFINKKDPQIKAECHEKYKKYRNLLSTLLKESKQIYYTKYFESNWNNIRNTWKGIKTIISIKNITTTIPHSIEFNNRPITDPTAMSNVFNNYFTSIAEKKKSNIKFSPKHTNYLPNTNTNTFLLTRTDKNEISFIISSLESPKSSDPNSIPAKILKFPKNDIFTMSFLTGQFSSVLKIAKVIPIHKKQSKVDYANYRPISLLSNIEKIIEKFMYKRLSNFLDINNLIYSLKFGFRQKFSTTQLRML